MENCMKNYDLGGVNKLKQKPASGSWCSEFEVEKFLKIIGDKVEYLSGTKLET